MVSNTPCRECLHFNVRWETGPYCHAMDKELDVYEEVDAPYFYCELWQAHVTHEKAKVPLRSNLKRKGSW